MEPEVVHGKLSTIRVNMKRTGPRPGLREPSVLAMQMCHFVQQRAGWGILAVPGLLPLMQQDLGHSLDFLKNFIV